MYCCEYFLLQFGIDELNMNIESRTYYTQRNLEGYASIITQEKQFVVCEEQVSFGGSVEGTQVRHILCHSLSRFSFQ